MATNGTTEAGALAATELEVILRNLLSPVNDVRNNAEKEFNRAKQKPGLCLEALSLLATASSDPGVREIAAVLLRRSASDLWDGADNAVRHAVKQRLLAGIRADGRKDLRKKLCDTTGHIGAPLIADNQWPELIPTLFELAKSPTPHERESALYIFSQLADYLDSKVLEPILEPLHEIFRANLNGNIMSVQLAALRATCTILNVLMSHLCTPFESLIPAMLRPVSESLQAGNEEDARTAIELLIDVVETEPQFWRKQLVPVSQVMLEVASSGRLDEDTRQMALEFLISIAEKLPSQCRKMGSFARAVFPICLTMMLELEDEQSWYAGDGDEDLSEFTNFHAGEEGLDRLAIALGGKSVLPVVEYLIPPYLENMDSWQHRHAAILAISQVGEGCRKQIGAKLGELTSMILRFFRDPHPRVRWAAINCIGQMCTDFGPEIQNVYHESIVPSLIAVMEDSSQPRVQSHSAAAMINFCDEASARIITPYLHDLLSKLRDLLQSPRRITKEQSITAIAAVADCAEQAFVNYYDEFMPSLKNVLSQTTGHKELRRLRGKVMECISLIGLSVGPEKFGKDAEDVMKVLVSTSSSAVSDADDPQSFYLMQAYARICRCLKQDFLPYLRHVMPAFVLAASQKPHIEVRDAVGEEDDEEEDGFETIQIGNKKIGIRTSALEEKATACTMIACFLHELKGGFYPYLEETINLMVPLLTFFYHDDCRIAAANSIGDFITCIKASQGANAPEQIAHLVRFVTPTLLDAIKNEPDADVLVAMTDALIALVNSTEAGMLSEPTLRDCAGALLVIIQESSTRTNHRLATAEAQDWDDEEREEAAEDEKKEEDLLVRCIDVITSLIQIHGECGFMSALEKDFSKQRERTLSCVLLFGAMLEPNKTPLERRTALCIFDDIISFGGERGAAYIPKVLPAMCTYSLDPRADVSQAAIFGVGECARVGGNLFIQGGGTQILQAMETVLTDPSLRERRGEAVDNFISALGKIMEFQPDCLQGSMGAKFGYLWLSHMPTNADKEEAPKIHAALVRSLERGDMRVLGDNYANLGKILSIFAEILGTQKIDAGYATRAVNVLRTGQAQLPQIFNNACSGLTDIQRHKLQQVVSN